MIFRFLTALSFCLLASLAQAQTISQLGPPSCGGDDIRTTLTAEEKAELQTRLAAIPFATGNHWQATRGEQVLHLIGTVHLADDRLDAVMARLSPLIARADLLLVEATAEEEAKLQDAIVTRPELLFLTNGPTLPELMPEEAWQALASAARDRGLPAFMAAKFQPWYLSVMLSMPGCVVQQMATGIRGFDHMIMSAATAQDVPQEALEPFDTLFNIMGSEPLETQISYLTLGTLPNNVAEDSLATLLASYFEERSAEVIEVSRFVARRHVDLPPDDVDRLMDDMLDQLLVARNVAWMPRILSAPDGLTIVAAGAAHLPGEQGLLALLEAEGFQLTQMPF